MKNTFIYIAAGAIVFYFYSKNQAAKANELEQQAEAAQRAAEAAAKTANRAVAEAAAQRAAYLKELAEKAKTAVKAATTAKPTGAAEAVNTWTKNKAARIRIKNTVAIPEVLKGATGTLVNTGASTILKGGQILSRSEMQITGYTSTTGRIIVSYSGKVYTIEPNQFDLVLV